MEEAKVDHVLLVTWLRVGDSTEWITGWPGWIEAIRVFKTNGALSRRKQGFESPRERHARFFLFCFNVFANLPTRVCQSFVL